ncbi:MAG: ATP-grasp domain-containing protein [Lacipirellulaceae bacterium]
MTEITWVLESDVFPETHAGLRRAISERGMKIVDWCDSWWYDGFPNSISGINTIFHGSLGNASAINEKLDWSPGALCNSSALECSSWYEAAKRWLIHDDYRILPANELVANTKAVAEELGSPTQLFLRPDSPLKPFSGRVLNVDAITLKALDHGFYFDDESIPVVVAPVRNIGKEWRFVVVGSEVVAGSEYDTQTRSATSDNPDSRAWNLANVIAGEIPQPSSAYMLDICESENELRLLELNPFGGADLYGCDPDSIVESVSKLISFE